MGQTRLKLHLNPLARPAKVAYPQVGLGQLEPARKVLFALPRMTAGADGQVYQLFRRSSRYWGSSFTATRSCCMVSRSRTVTVSCRVVLPSWLLPMVS
ncbi:MAG: hypothetical protein KatS3mg071_0481 [Meiothermus sp.]|nr:MAG: hypothetical protein KatS3mg071_0481 [Meiothermus sp.]